MILGAQQKTDVWWKNISIFHFHTQWMKQINFDSECLVQDLLKLIESFKSIRRIYFPIPSKFEPTINFCHPNVQKVKIRGSYLKLFREKPLKFQLFTKPSQSLDGQVNWYERKKMYPNKLFLPLNETEIVSHFLTLTYFTWLITKKGERKRKTLFVYVRNKNETSKKKKRFNYETDFIK